MRACQVVACQRKVCARASSALPGGGARRVSRAGVCPARSRVTRGVCVLCIISLLCIYFVHICSTARSNTPLSYACAVAGTLSVPL